MMNLRKYIILSLIFLFIITSVNALPLELDYFYPVEGLQESVYEPEHIFDCSSVFVIEPVEKNDNLFLVDYNIDFEIDAPGAHSNMRLYATSTFHVYSSKLNQTVDLQIRPEISGRCFNDIEYLHIYVNGIEQTPQEPGRAFGRVARDEYLSHNREPIVRSVKLNSVYNEIKVKVDFDTGIQDAPVVVIDYSNFNNWNLSKFTGCDTKIIQRKSKRYTLGYDYLYFYEGLDSLDFKGNSFREGNETYLTGDDFLVRHSDTFDQENIYFVIEPISPSGSLFRIPNTFNPEKLTATDYMKLASYCSTLCTSQSWLLSSCSVKLFEILSQLEPQQLRLLRNAYFANQGYVFTDPELQAFFSTGIAYRPNPDCEIFIQNDPRYGKNDYDWKSKGLTWDYFETEKDNYSLNFMFQAIRAAENGEDYEKAFWDEVFKCYTEDDLIYWG